MTAEIAQAAIAGYSPASRAVRAFQLTLLTGALTAAVYAKAAVGPLQETMRAALALTDNQMALLQGPALGLPMAMAAIPVGLIIDRYSRVRLVVILSIVVILGSMLTVVARSFSILFLGRALVGLAAFAMTPATSSLLADLYPPAQRGRASMVMAVGQFGGVSAVFALGGVLASWYSTGGVDAWRSAMFWLTCPVVALTTLLLLALREPPRTERVIETPTAKESFAEFWRYRPIIVPSMAGVVIVGVALESVFVWTVPALSRNFGLGPDRAGAIMATAVLISGVAGSILGGILADYCQRGYGPRRTLSVLSGLAFLTVPLSLFGVVPHMIAASVLLVGLVGVLVAILVMGTTLFIVAIPNELRGLCNGVVTAMGAIVGVGTAPVVVSLLSGALGGPAMIGKSLAVVCAAAGFLCGATFLFGSRFVSCAEVPRVWAQ